MGQSRWASNSQRGRGHDKTKTNENWAYFGGGWGSFYYQEDSFFPMFLVHLFGPFVLSFKILKPDIFADFGTRH